MSYLATFIHNTIDFYLVRPSSSNSFKLISMKGSTVNIYNSNTVFRLFQILKLCWLKILIYRKVISKQLMTIGT